MARLSLSQKQPRELLTAERLDIAVKWRFFRHLLEGGDPDSERVYRWHIQRRTGGHERNGSGNWKRTVQDYVDACPDLLGSMLVNGFHTSSPLEYGCNGRLRDGAHRLSCALLLKCDVMIEAVDRDGTATWGEMWFRQNGIAQVDLDRIHADWKCLSALSS